MQIINNIFVVILLFAALKDDPRGRLGFRRCARYFRLTSWKNEVEQGIHTLLIYQGSRASVKLY